MQNGTAFTLQNGIEWKTFRMAQRLDCILVPRVPAMRPIFTAVKLEQFIYELAQFDQNTGETTEARMDIVAETGHGERPQAARSC